MADLGGSLLEPVGGAREELKTQFMTREGTYQLMTLSEYTRPNRVGYNTQPANCNTPVKVVPGNCILSNSVSSSQVSFVTSDTEDNAGEKIAFNYGRELFVYPYRGVAKAADLTKPIDKRVYKGTFPTCHDFGPPGCLKDENVTPDSEVTSFVILFEFPGGCDPITGWVFWWSDSVDRPREERAF